MRRRIGPGHEAEARRVGSARIVGMSRGISRAEIGSTLEFADGGSLLFTAQEWGFHAVGADRHSGRAEALKNFGYESHCAPIEALDFPGRFSVVSLVGRLERVAFPRTTLDAAHRMLKPGGVLFVSTPNMATIVWRLRDVGGHNPAWGDIEHYHNFTRDRLYALLQTHGFKPAAYAVGEPGHSVMEVIAVKG